MGAINPQRVASKVSETIRKGKLVNFGKIIKETGYAKTTSLKPKLVTTTKAYRKTMAIEAIPLVQGLQEEVTRIKKAMANKDLNNEEYRTLVGSLDIITKNYQLLSGGATERQVFVIPSEIMEKNKIKESQPLIDGSVEPL